MGLTPSPSRFTVPKQDVSKWLLLQNGKDVHTFIMALLSFSIIEPHPASESNWDVHVTLSRAGLEVYSDFNVCRTIAGDGILDRSLSIGCVCSSRAFGVRDRNGDGFSSGEIRWNKASKMNPEDLPVKEYLNCSTSGIPTATLAVIAVDSPRVLAAANKSIKMLNRSVIIAVTHFLRLSRRWPRYLGRFVLRQSCCLGPIGTQWMPPTRTRGNIQRCQ